MKDCRRCLIGGNFIFLHYGHIYLFKKAKEFCDELIVVLARDELQKKKYGKIITPIEKRKELLESISFIDKVVIGSKEKHKVVDEEDINCIILGCDQELPFDKDKINKKIKIIRLDCDEKEKYSNKRYLYDLW